MTRLKAPSVDGGARPAWFPLYALVLELFENAKVIAVWRVIPVDSRKSPGTFQPHVIIKPFLQKKWFQIFSRSFARKVFKPSSLIEPTFHLLLHGTPLPLCPIGLSRHIGQVQRGEESHNYGVRCAPGGLTIESYIISAKKGVLLK